MATAVVTRDAVDAQPYASALAALGFATIAMPVTRIVSAADPDALARALEGGPFDAVLVASQRAAHELAHAAGRRRAAPATALELPEVWAVGPATKRALDVAQLAAQLPPDVRDGVELARKLVAARDLRGKRVLVPRAEDGRTEPLEILRAAGAEVVDIVAYRTVAVAPDDAEVRAGAEALVAGTAQLVCVFAPSQVAALAEILDSRGRALASLGLAWCAIGETTAQALRALGVAGVAVAAAPTPEGMAHAASSVYPPRA